MEKKLICLLTVLMMIACSSESDNEELETIETDPKLNITEGVLSCDGDSINIISGNGKELYACYDTVGMKSPIVMEYTSKENVSDKVRYLISDRGWYSVTEVYSTETKRSSRIILKVKPNHTQKSRTVPLAIFSYCYDFNATGNRKHIYTKTNFVQDVAP